MLIIKGNVQTSDGPIPVENLQEGMLLADFNHRARKLLKIEQQEAKAVLSFERNKGLELSSDSVLLTAFGKRSAVPVDGIKTLKNETVQMPLPNPRVQLDKIILEEKTATGYALAVEDGKNVLVNDYCIVL